ncbi:MAG: cadmium resistance transporter [Burkholderiaceae bacterium]|nr:cadmium resistance transporter [Burkholderiaceae bacterium]
MEHYLALVILAVGLFATTNIDDVFVLLGFYADRRFNVRQVVLGQYIGIAALYSASVVASLIALVISPAYVGLLGFVPIVLGLTKVWQLSRRPEGDEEDGLRTTIGHGNVLAVAAVTIANGADNMSIYTPLFATRSAFDVACIGAVFAVMTAVWLVAAHWLINHETIGAPIRRYGHRVVPFVLIALGFLILHEAGTLNLLLHG